MAYIGKSLLPSNCARILAPLGEYQVKVCVELDTHVLLWKQSMIAEHPNGYSCYELAARMTAGDVDRALAQHAYILACGGMAASEDTIRSIMADYSR